VDFFTAGCAAAPQGGCGYSFIIHRNFSLSTGIFPLLIDFLLFSQKRARRQFPSSANAPNVYSL
jgi:hypothetical protein